MCAPALCGCSTSLHKRRSRARHHHHLRTVLCLPARMPAGALPEPVSCTMPAQFDGVLENVSQEALYAATAAEVVDSVLAGYSGCVFAYGQVTGRALSTSS